MAAEQVYVVTGASGFLGSWIAYLLLQAGHSVKGTTRGVKMELVKTAFAKYSKFEAVAIPEVASGDFESLFRGVHAVFHTAAAIPGRESYARNATADGSLNVLEQADSAGVRNVVVTSSLGSFPPTGPFGAEDFNKLSTTDAANNAWILYCAEKAAGDQAVLAFADAHPWMNVSIVAPGSFFGPFAPGFELILVDPDYRGLSTNAYIAALLRPENDIFSPTVGGVDVRDVAKAHISVLRVPATYIGRRRWPLLSPYESSWQSALVTIAQERPELTGRMSSDAKAPLRARYTLPLDHNHLSGVFDIASDSYITWRDTVLAAVDDLLRLEKIWSANGKVLSLPRGGRASLSSI